MTTNRKRGRPKGTGLDDSQTLAQIADIIAANPTIKRTTAIKKTGVTNPSTVRRLRDKFQAEESALLAEARRRLASASYSASRTNGTQPTPRLDGLAFIAATQAAHSKLGRAAAAQPLANTSGHSKKTGPAIAQPAASASAQKPVRPLPGITSLFLPGDVSPLEVAQDIVAIRNAILNSTQPLELIIGLLRDVNIENIVTQGLSLLMGVRRDKLDESPVASLLAGQAKMLDVILPLLQMQFAAGSSANAAAAGSSTTTKKTAAA